MNKSNIFILFIIYHSPVFDLFAVLKYYHHCTNTRSVFLIYKVKLGIPKKSMYSDFYQGPNESALFVAGQKTLERRRGTTGEAESFLRLFLIFLKPLALGGLLV